MQKKEFIRQLNELVPRPDPVTTEALYRFDRECAESEYIDMLTALRVVARNFSGETLQGAYELIQVGPHLLQTREDGEAALQLVHPAVPLCGMAQPHSGQEFQGALILLGRDREGDSCLAVLRVCRVAQDTAQHRPSVLCGHICCPPVSWPWGVM